MVLVPTEVVFVTSVRSPRVLATYRGKVIYWRGANPCKEVNERPWRHESVGCWFKYFFLNLCYLKYSCTITLSWNLYITQVRVTKCFKCLMYK